jgi:hypothetical protein
MGVAKSLGLGLVAGVAGTGAMTAYQLGVAKLRGQPLETPVPHRWSDAPAPAQVAKRIAEAIGQGRRLTRDDVPRLTNGMHWLYGVGWGTLYGLVAGLRGANPVAGGLAFGTGVWAASYLELVPLGIYEPPWKYPPGEIALDLSYHLVYGVAVAGAFEALER